MPVSWRNYASGPWCLELLLRPCKWELGGQGSAVHTEQHQVRKVRAHARSWLPPRQRTDQVAPYSQPGSLPTAELLQGWFEAQRISPRPHTVLRTAPASRPQLPAISPPLPGLPGVTRGGAGTERRYPCQSTHLAQKQIGPCQPWAARPADSSCQRSRVTQQPGNGAREAAPLPGFRGAVRWRPTRDSRGQEPRVRCPTCLSPSLSAHTTGSGSRPAATRLAGPEELLPRPQTPPCPAAPRGGARAPRPPGAGPCPCPCPRTGGAPGYEPGRNVLKRAHSRCSSFVGCIWRSDGSVH